jgi:hypothetical protein
MAQAANNFVAGNHIIPNVPGLYVINITASGTDSIGGMNLTVFTGNNGGDLTASIPDAPTITNVSVTGAGTIFEFNNQTPSVATAGTNIWQIGLITASGTIEPDGPDVPAHGNIAGIVTIDTTGFGPGVYDLWVGDNNPLFGAGLLGSDWAGTATPTWTEPGSITIVPEPGSVVLALFAAAGVAGVVIRRRRRAA